MSPEARMAKKKNGAAKSTSQSRDAIALLKGDHRQVEQWFEQFSKSRSEAKKQQLADSICQALTVHTTIEEEIFYPAFIEATRDRDTHHEAIVEHAGAKHLIEQIRAMKASDDYFDAKVTVLSEMIKHHVKEEEQRGGMFAEAKDSDLDLVGLGQQLLARKQQLTAGNPPRKR
jgi:hemerythrin superfamily protein